MAKMGEIAMDLDEEAVVLGFLNLEDALANGYTVDYENHKLVKELDVEQELEKAHAEWLKKKDHKLRTLRLIAEVCRESDLPNTADDLENIATFFEEGEI